MQILDIATGCLDIGPSVQILAQVSSYWSKMVRSYLRYLYFGKGVKILVKVFEFWSHLDTGLSAWILDQVSRYWLICPDIRSHVQILEKVSKY